jgi:ribokinase
MTESHIAVVGSFVMDLVVWLPHFPRKGETLHPTRFEMFAGGKGFNQAVTARRCGAQVSMVGRVGDDAFGETFLQLMGREAIDSRFVTRDRAVGTSLGIPMIDPNGDNSIIGIPRANTRLSLEDVQAASEVIAQARVLLLQLEVLVETSRRAAQIAREAGRLVILNPAPAHMPIDALLSDNLIDWLIPNEIEAEMLAGVPVRSVDDARAAAQALLARGIRQGVIITLGAQGALAVTRDGVWHAPAFAVTPVDPTGAGDAFCGAFGVALAQGQPIARALRFANAAGALCATVAGAEPSLPRRGDVEQLARSVGKGG